MEKKRTQKKFVLHGKTYQLQTNMFKIKRQKCHNISTTFNHCPKYLAQFPVLRETKRE